MNIPIDPISQFKENNAPSLFFINAMWGKKYYILFFILISVLFFFSLKYFILEKSFVAKSEIHPNPKVSYSNKNPLNIAMSLNSELRNILVGYEFGPDGKPTVSFLDPDEILNEFVIYLKDEDNIFLSAKEFLDQTEIVSEIDKQGFIERSVDNFDFYIDLFSGVSKYSNFIVVEFHERSNELAESFLTFHINRALLNFNELNIEERDYRIGLAISRIESDVRNLKREIGDQKKLFQIDLESSLRRLERDKSIAESLNIVDPTSSSPSIVLGDFFIDPSNKEDLFVDPLHKESSYWKGTKVLEGEINYVKAELENDSKSIMALKLKLEHFYDNIDLLKEFRSFLKSSGKIDEVFYVSWSEKSVTSRMDFISDIKLLVISLIVGFLIGFTFSVIRILRINKT